MESEEGKRWTLERAEGAVKAALFYRETATLHSSEPARLRFSEIREIVGKREGLISDKTLTAALDALVGKGQIKRDRQGSATFYTLGIPDEEKIRSQARMDANAIERAVQLGGYSQVQEGWAVYGVAPGLPKRVGDKLREEALRHQARLRAILDDLWGEALDAILLPSKKRLKGSVHREGRRALQELVRAHAVGSMSIAYGVRFWQVVEGTVPGAAQAFREGLGVTWAPETPLPQRMSAVISKLADIPLEEIQPEMDKMMTRIPKLGLAVKPLWESLTPREKERAGRRWGLATAMAMNLTSVVHA